MGKGAVNKGYIQNLRNNKMMQFIYNPSEWEYSFSTEYAEMNAPGSAHPLYQFVGGSARTLTFTILLDGREKGYQAVQEQMHFLGVWHPVNVSNNTFNPPPSALFAMGWFTQKVLIENVTYNATMFDTNLNPIRVEATISMKTVM